MHAHTEARVVSMYNRKGYQRKGRQEIGEGPVVDSDAKSTATRANEANGEYPTPPPKTQRVRERGGYPMKP